MRPEKAAVDDRAARELPSGTPAPERGVRWARNEGIGREVRNVVLCDGATNGS